MMEKIVIKKQRDSNIELCRIVSMMMIIAHHAVVHGGGLQGGGKWMAYAFIPGGKICFDTFIAISCWFLVDQQFKSERFIKMWLEVLFYSIITTLVALCLGSVLSRKEIFSAFLPITGGVQGYAQTYLAFYLLIPFLSKISKSITKGQNQFIIVVLTLYVVVFRIMSSLIASEQSIYCRVILFVYIYFLMLYIKRYPIGFLGKPMLVFSIFLIGWGMIYGYYMGTVMYPELVIWRYVSIFVVDEGGILFLLTGLSFFFFFKEIHIAPNRFINFFGATTLAVLLIHDGHFSRGWTWKWLNTVEWFRSKIFGFIICVVLIYLVCSIIDDIRKSLLEDILFETPRMKALCRKMDNWINDVD